MSKEKEGSQENEPRYEVSEENQYRRAYLEEKLDSIERSRQSIAESYEAIMGEQPDFAKEDPESPESLRRLIDSPPPDKVRSVDFKKQYNNLYTETQDILSLLREEKKESQKWRMQTWIWRLFSLLLMVLLSVDYIISDLTPFLS